MYSQPYRLETGLWRGVVTDYEKGVMLVKVHQDYIRNESVQLPHDAPFRIRGRVALNWFVAELDSVLLHDERSTAGAIEAILRR